MRSWGATPQERGASYPCDAVLDGATESLWRAITVDAEPGVVFRWLCQLRAAPYSYDWIDNFGRRSPETLTPGLDGLAVGQSVMRIFELVAFERDRHLTLRLRRPGVFPPLAASYCVAPHGARRTRLVVKLVVRTGPRARHRVAAFLLRWGDLVMMRRQLLNLKRLAEG